ncbi:MAG: Holliday junction resolvase, partial [Spirochaetaceae bacterium]|nr:Holliday junction resolvase [Spirochaetaceae bacterium]
MLFVLCFRFGKKIGAIEAEKNQDKLLEEARIDAVRRSRSVLNGQLVEQVAPFLPGFPCNPADCRFIGKPLDFIAFAGLEEHDNVDEILFIEVKTNSSQLSQRERSLKEAV